MFDFIITIHKEMGARKIYIAALQCHHSAFLPFVAVVDTETLDLERRRSDEITPLSRHSNEPFPLGFVHCEGRLSAVSLSLSPTTISGGSLSLRQPVLVTAVRSIKSPLKVCEV